MAGIHGYCDQRFHRVREAFAENFASRGEIGACVALVLEGKLVVDLWGGFADFTQTRAWQQDTLVNVWSLGKAMTGLNLLHAVDQELISYETPIASVWPAFAANNKADITLGTILSHKAGLCAVETPLQPADFFNWQRMTSALAAQKPFWTPGEYHGYHTNTLGFLAGEPLCRVSGETFNGYFQRNLMQPLGTDFHFGVPEQDLHRVADIANAPRPPEFANRILGENPDLNDPLTRMRQLVYQNPGFEQSGDNGLNSVNWRRSVFPSTAPHSNARSIATIFGWLASILNTQQSDIVSKDNLRLATQIHADGEDRVMQRPTRFGYGFQLTQPDRPLGPHSATFGHYGNGGHLGFADPDVPLGFSYNMNLHGFAWRDPRNIALTDAVYDSL
ncbi:MAG: beta-lactamase family protein [Pseudomonadales bacterium]|nr:beta-lactamase family protein [Pseudomonadales bacterium]